MRIAFFNYDILVILLNIVIFNSVHILNSFQICRCTIKIVVKIIGTPFGFILELDLYLAFCTWDSYYTQTRFIFLKRYLKIFIKSKYLYESIYFIILSICNCNQIFFLPGDQIPTYLKYFLKSVPVIEYFKKVYFTKP